MTPFSIGFSILDLRSDTKIMEMSEASDSKTGQKRSKVKQLVQEQPRWKKAVLTIAILLGVVGAAWQAKVAFIDKPPAPETRGSGSDLPGGVSSLSRSSGSRTGEPETREPTVGEKVSPWMTKVGISFAAGLVLGIVFRTFVKTMLLLSILAVGGLIALSYLNVLNIDLTAAQEQAQSASTWMTDQATRLKDSIMARLPTASTSTIGFVLGFKRK